MLRVEEARQTVVQHADLLPPVAVTLAVASGRVLAQDITSDIDSPPHDKSLMDGYAVRIADLPEGKGTLSIVEQVLAGQTPAIPLGPGQATLVMTGAPIPSGADAVIPRERAQAQGDRVEFAGPPPRPGDSIMRRGSEMRAGEVVLKAGTLIRPVEIGVLATVGRGVVSVIPAPRVAILSTGDELVSPGAQPGPGQIRNSNGPMLMARVARAGAVPESLGIARDDHDDLASHIRRGLAFDLLILSGGVSAGDRDLVPAVLAEEGVTAHFHKVSMKPGKPVLFGTRPRRSGPPVLVFGLPGNPVSSLACFELFVRPALCLMAGLPEPSPMLAVLAEDFPYRSDRPTYYPALLATGENGPVVRPVAWQGSADLHSLTRANALLVLPAGESVHRAGQTFSVLELC